MLASVISEEPADSDDVRWCFERYCAKLGRLFEYAADTALPLGLDELTPPRGLVLVVRTGGEPVGCGAVKLAEPRVAEIKRMWVAEQMRGRGLGARILVALESRAIEAGESVVRLDTNGSLDAAMALYRSHGYREVSPFNVEPYADHWFMKDLAKDGQP